MRSNLLSFSSHTCPYPVVPFLLLAPLFTQLLKLESWKSFWLSPSLSSSTTCPGDLLSPSQTHSSISPYYQGLFYRPSSFFALSTSIPFSSSTLAAWPELKIRRFNKNVEGWESPAISICYSIPIMWAPNLNL